MFNDPLNNQKIQISLAPIVLSASGAPVSMDKKGAEATVHSVAVGVLANPDASDHFQIILHDSDDDSTFAAVTDVSQVIFKVGNTITTPEAIASGIMKNLDDAGDAGEVYTVAYVGNKRYSKIVLTEVVSADDATAAIGVVSYNTNLTNAGGSGVIGT
jgi:hypothetical protein